MPSLAHGARYRPLLPALVGAALALAATAAPARETPRSPARSGLELAAAAAQSWAADAFLIYIENDEPVDARGDAERWAYLFYSPGLDRARGFSVRNGRIAAAENLEMRLEAPPLDDGWIDSGAALAAAEKAVAAAYRRSTRGELQTMLLMRGAFSEGDPDRTTWTLIYHAAGQPPLFVVVDATDAKVRRTWRG